MSKKSHKLTPKNPPIDTPLQTGSNCKDEASECKTKHPGKPEARDYRFLKKHGKKSMDGKFPSMLFSIYFAFVSSFGSS